MQAQIGLSPHTARAHIGVWKSTPGQRPSRLHLPCNSVPAAVCLTYLKVCPIKLYKLLCILPCIIYLKICLMNSFSRVTYIGSISTFW